MVTLFNGITTFSGYLVPKIAGGWIKGFITFQVLVWKWCHSPESWPLYHRGFPPDIEREWNKIREKRLTDCKTKGVVEEEEVNKERREWEEGGEKGCSIELAEDEEKRQKKNGRKI